MREFKMIEDLQDALFAQEMIDKYVNSSDPYLEAYVNFQAAMLHIWEIREF